METDAVQYKNYRSKRKYHVQSKEKTKQKREHIKMAKRYGLMIFWLFFVVIFMTFEEKHLLEKTLEVPQEYGKSL